MTCIKLRDEARRIGGFVAKYMGGGVLVYFGYPQAHEDDLSGRRSAPVALLDHVADMDADPKFDAPFWRQACIPLDHAVLAQRTASTTLRNSMMLPSPCA